MRKIIVLMLFALLSIASVSQVMADYELPTGTIDIPVPSAGIDPCLTQGDQGNVGLDCCDLDAGQGHVGFDPCCIFDSGEQGHVGFGPCCDFGSAGQGHVGLGCCDLDAGRGYIGDPCILPCVFGGGDDVLDCCDIFDLEVNADSTLPSMISLDYHSTEITNLDATLGIDEFDECDEEKVEPSADGSDLDADGILDENDNCPTDYNPDQKNSWGTGAGDACEIPYRSDNNLVFGFFGSINAGFYGFCMVDEGCQYIATITPADFASIMASDDYQDAGDYSDELAGGKVLNVEDGNPSRLTVLFQVGTDGDGNPIYQINIYILQQKLGDNGETETFPMLVDDDVNIIVQPDGTWTWWDKNPN